MTKQILFAYVPVLHRGYEEFFAKYAGATLYLISREELLAFEELEYLKKDIRVLSVAKAQQAIKSFDIFEIVKSIKIDDIDKIIYSLKSTINAPEKFQLIFTNDDIGHFLAEHFFASAEEKIFESIFLRWDKNLMSEQKEVSPDVIITQDDFARQTMTQAFQAAGHSSDWWRHVGSVIVKDGQIISLGSNEHLPSPDQQYKNGDPRISFSSGVGADFSSSIHAEANLIALAAKRGLALAGAEMFVTTFPCPVCAKQIAVAGIKRVYYAKGYAVLDGLEILRSFGVEVVLVKFSKDEFKEIEKLEQLRSKVKDCYML